MTDTALHMERTGNWACRACHRNLPLRHQDRSDAETQKARRTGQVQRAQAFLPRKGDLDQRPAALPKR